MQKSRFLKMMLRKHFPPQDAIEAEEVPIVLDGWSFPLQHTFGSPNPRDTTDKYVMRVYQQVLETHREKSEQHTLKRLKALSKSTQHSSMTTRRAAPMEKEPCKSAADMQPQRSVGKRCRLSERELYHRFDISSEKWKGNLCCSSSSTSTAAPRALAWPVELHFLVFFSPAVHKCAVA